MNPYIFDPVNISKALNDFNGKAKDYPILKENGAFAIETRGWLFKPTNGSQAFCRTVKVYMEREQALLDAGVVNPKQAKDSVLKLADYNIRLNQLRPELTVDECRKLSGILTASPVQGLHEIENQLFQLIISGGSGSDMRSSVNQLCMIVYDNPEADDEVIKRFFLQETDALKRQCEQLFPAGLPDTVQHGLNTVQALFQFAASPQIAMEADEGTGSAVVGGGEIASVNRIGTAEKGDLHRSVDHDSGAPRHPHRTEYLKQPGLPNLAPSGKMARKDADGKRDICWASLYDHMVRKISPFDRPFNLQNLQRLAANISDITLADAALGKKAALAEICGAAHSLHSLPGLNPVSEPVVKKIRPAGNLPGMMDDHMSYQDFRQRVVGTLTEPGLVSYRPGLDQSLFYSSRVLPADTRPVRQAAVAVCGEDKKSGKPSRGQTYTRHWIRQPGGRLVSQDSTEQAAVEKTGDGAELLANKQTDLPGADKPVVNHVVNHVVNQSMVPGVAAGLASEVNQHPQTLEEKLKEIELWRIKVIPGLQGVDRQTIQLARQDGVYDDTDLTLLFDESVSSEKTVAAQIRLTDKIKDYQKARNRAERERKFPVEGPLLMPSAVTNGFDAADNTQTYTGLPDNAGPGRSPLMLRMAESVAQNGQDSSGRQISSTEWDIHKLSVQERDYYRGLELDMMFKIDNALFDHLLQGFLKMKKLLAPVMDNGHRLLPGDITDLISAFPHWHRHQPFDLNFLHFHTLINNYLVTANEMDDILAHGTRAIVTAYGPYSRLLQQYPVDGMTGFGLTNWGNTAWINSAIQTMVRTVAVEQVSQLPAHLDCDLERLRLSFQQLLIIGQKTLNEENGLRPGVITLWQRKFIEALIICARVGKLGKMNDWFNVGAIPDIAQHDSVLFIDGIRDLLGINDDGSQAFATVYYHEAMFNGKKIYKCCQQNGMNGYQLQHTLRSSGPASVKNAELVAMQDWYDGIFAIAGKSEIRCWLSGELSGIEPACQDPEPAYADHDAGGMGRSQQEIAAWSQAWAQAGYLYLLPVNRSPAQYLLRTREKCLHKIDSSRFTHTILALDITDNQQLARTALLNTARYENNELKIRVFDVHDGENKILVLRLTGVTLYKEPQRFYIRLSIARGQCEEVQSDNISLPFDRYRNCFRKAWRSWIEMVEQEEYIPAYCEYKAMRFEHECVADKV